MASSRTVPKAVLRWIRAKIKYRTYVLTNQAGNVRGLTGPGALDILRPSTESRSPSTEGRCDRVQ